MMADLRSSATAKAAMLSFSLALLSKVSGLLEGSSSKSGLVKFPFCHNFRVSVEYFIEHKTRKVLHFKL